MNISTTHSTTKQSYQNLSEAERGKIETYLSEGLSYSEIARRLGRHRSTISREIKRGAVTQVKKQNGKKSIINSILRNLPKIVIRSQGKQPIF